MWQLLVFSHVFMLINGSDGLLVIILNLMISRAHCLRKHLGVLVPFPCPAISHYFGSNQKPNPSALRFCRSLQPLRMEVKIVTVVLFSGFPWRPRARPFSVHSTEGGSDGNERIHVKQRVKGASGREGRQCQKPVGGRWPKDRWTMCFCQLGEEEMTVFFARV